MNVLPMLLNVFIPWGIFALVGGLCSSWLMYQQPTVAWLLVAAVYILWGLTVRKAVEARRWDPEPSWFSYVALAVGVAVLCGTCFGLSNFALYRRAYFAIHDLKFVRNLDVGREYGQNWMDAGILEFKPGSELDGLKSWHFKHGTVYCVAPVVINHSQPETQSYDFWAVGKDCCSTSSSDFRCGAWASADARRAVRVLDDEDAPFYRLAVKQAETLYGIAATHPIFLRWSRDPVAEVNSWNQRAFRNYVFAVLVALVVSLFAVAVATCQFAFIGRSQKMDIYGDPNWNPEGCYGEGYYGDGYYGGYGMTGPFGREYSDHDYDYTTTF